MNHQRYRRHRALYSLIALLGLLGSLFLAPLQRIPQRQAQNLSLLPNSTATSPGVSVAQTAAAEQASDLNFGETRQNMRVRINETIGNLPLSFEANSGQVNERFQFLTRGSNYSVALTPTEAVIALSGQDRAVTSGENLAPNRSALLSMQLVGGNSHARGEGLGRLQGNVSYFVGNDPQRWRADILSYQRVQYSDVYPGINIVYYGNQREVEYDLIVSPNARPETINLSFAGAREISIDAQGSMILRTELGDVRMSQPVIYQEINHVRQNVSGRYVLKGLNQVGFEVAAYDRSEPLVIDPVISYGSYLGGSGNEAGFDIALDSAGQVYLTGSTNSSEFSALGGSNAFVVKLNAAGTERLYTAILGGSGDDTSFGIAVDSAGSAYVTGTTNSADFATAVPLQANFGGGSIDAFAAKLSPDGSALVYSTFLGGSGDDMGFAIAIDNTGSAYLTGATDSNEFSSLSGSNVFIAKLNSTGSERAYFVIAGGSGEDRGFGIAVDAGGNAYLTGSTDSTNFTTANPLQPAAGGINDAFVAKLNAEGSAFIYSTYFGGTGDDAGFDIDVDAAGNAYVVGATDSQEFSSMSGSNVFVAKFNAEGSERSYLAILGGDGNDAGFGIAVDSVGNAHITGVTDSTNFTTVNALQSNLGGGSQDAFIAKLNPAGSSLIYASYLGGRSDDVGFSIALDSGGAAYITGFTNSDNFPMANSLQSALGGDGDAFFAKITDSVSAPTVQFSAPSYSVDESAGRVAVTVTRNDDTTAASVSYVTNSNAGNAACNAVTGLASARCDFLGTAGTIHFAAGQASAQIPIPIIDDGYVEGSEIFTVSLSNPVGTTLGTLSTAVITIVDNDTPGASNPVDAARFFVRQHYLDFLSREPDAGGWDFWANDILACQQQHPANSPALAFCIEDKRNNVSAAYFLSIEFQETGYLVYRFYRSSFPESAARPRGFPRFVEFMQDTRAIGQGVVVGQAGWDAHLEANKQAFALAWVQREEFIARYPESLTAGEYINRLFETAGVTPTAAERQAAIDEFANQAGGLVGQRARALRSVTESETLRRQEFNRAFVLMQYFGYLRRNPNEGPDTDFGGYDFWLGKLNEHNGNFISSQMVLAFIRSLEYRNRFGQP